MDYLEMNGSKCWSFLKSKKSQVVAPHAERCREKLCLPLNILSMEAKVWVAEDAGMICLFVEVE